MDATTTAPRVRSYLRQPAGSSPVGPSIELDEPASGRGANALTARIDVLEANVATIRDRLEEIADHISNPGEDVEQRVTRILDERLRPIIQQSTLHDKRIERLEKQLTQLHEATIGSTQAIETRVTKMRQEMTLGLGVIIVTATVLMLVTVSR